MLQHISGAYIAIIIMDGFLFGLGENLVKILSIHMCLQSFFPHSYTHTSLSNSKTHHFPADSTAG